MMMPFDFHVHGLWILGAVMIFLGALIAGNIEWVEGTTPFSFWIAIFISFFLLLIAGMAWISSAVNARNEE